MKISKTKSKVRNLLIKKPHLRDDDNKLIASIWYNEANIKMTKISGEDFLHLLADGKLTSSESIRRSRQKIQEDEPDLRGESYKKRQGKLQEETKEELGYRKPYKD